MRAKDVLLEALETFTGTLVFVSHDRYFLDKLATRIFEVEDGHVNVYPGNYEDYRWRKSGKPALSGQPAAPAVDPAEAAVAAPAPASAEPAGTNGGTRPSEKRLNPIKMRQLKERQEAIEVEVSKLEAEIADYEAALANFVSADETRRVSTLLDERRVDLTNLMNEWEQVAQSIDANT